MLKRGFFSGKTRKVAQRLAALHAAAHNPDSLKAMLDSARAEHPDVVPEDAPASAPGAIFEWWILGLYLVRSLVNRTLAEYREDRDALLEDFLAQCQAIFSESSLTKEQETIFAADVEQRFAAYDAPGDNDDQRLDSAASLLLAPEIDRYSRFRFVFQHLLAEHVAQFSEQVRQLLSAEPE
jgi:hypothetical protein